MESLKHTPWIVKPRHRVENDFEVINQIGAIVAVVSDLALARLIVEAPLLLAAIIAYRGILSKSVLGSSGGLPYGDIEEALKLTDELLNRLDCEPPKKLADIY